MMVTRVLEDTAAPPPPAGDALGLEGLANDAEKSLTPPPGDGVTDLDVAEREQSEQAAQAMAVIEAAVGKIVYGGLRAVRSKIARKNPFILEEWTDEMLRAPADAAVPVLRKRLGMVFELMGQAPEEAALAMAAFPLLLGWIAADERNAKTPKLPAAPRPEGATASAPTPAPTNEPTFPKNDPRNYPLNAT